MDLLLQCGLHWQIVYLSCTYCLYLCAALPTQYMEKVLPVGYSDFRNQSIACMLNINPQGRANQIKKLFRLAMCALASAHCHCTLDVRHWLRARSFGRQARLAKYLDSSTFMGFVTCFLFLLLRALVTTLRSLLSSCPSLLYYEVCCVLCTTWCISHWCPSRCHHQVLGQNCCCAEQVHHRSR